MNCRFASMWVVVFLLVSLPLWGHGGSSAEKPAPGELPEAIKNLKSPDDVVRKHAIDDVAASRSKLWNPMLQELRKDKSAIYGDSVARVLTKGGKNGRKYVTKFLTDKEVHVRKTGILAAGYGGQVGGVYLKALLRILTRDSEPMLRFLAAGALARIGKAGGDKISSTVSRYLCSALQREKHPEARRGILEAIGYLGVGSPVVFKLLSEMMNSEDPTERGYAARMMMGFPMTSDLLELLSRALEDPVPDVWMPTHEAIQAAGPAAKVVLPILADLLDHPDKKFEILILFSAVSEREFDTVEDAKAWWAEQMAVAEGKDGGEKK